MSDCILCKILAGDIPSNPIYEDDKIIAFPDISPKAPVHLLVIPRKHIESLASLESSDQEIVAHLTAKLAQIAADHGLGKGFRTVVNTGAWGGQEVFHLHYQILGDPEQKLSLAALP